MYSQSSFPRNSHRGKKFKSKPQKNRSFQGGKKRGPVGTFNPKDIINNTLPSQTREEKFIPKHKFSDFQVDEDLKRNIVQKGYTSPSPIQDESIPHILEGKDIIGIANTGTGKTAAFLIPLIHKVLQDRTQKVLIVTPTRELAIQIQEEFIAFSRSMNTQSILIIGGVNAFHQKRALKQPFNFVVGTPGRIKDLIKSNNLNLSQFRNIVLDEADHMVDIGFIQDIKFIISLLPEKRQSLFFSATIDRKVQEIINQFVKNPITISVKKSETTHNINQKVIKTITQNKKIEQLHEVLIKSEFEKVIIFGRTKHGIQKLSNELVYRGFKAGAIHGNKSQNQRQRTLKEFKHNVINILLATDVASRGLDIDNVSHVINYDMPATYEDYIHRIGRTGRANKKGVALTFV